MGWADQGGIPYALAQLQSSTGTAMLDNADGHLTPSNSASPWYPDVTTGTPVRLRVALGTLTGPLGSTVVNRWYVIQRNMLDAQEKRDSNMRGLRGHVPHRHLVRRLRVLPVALPGRGTPGHPLRLVDMRRPGRGRAGTAHGAAQLGAGQHERAEHRAEPERAGAAASVQQLRL